MLKKLTIPALAAALIAANGHLQAQEIGEARRAVEREAANTTETARAEADRLERSELQADAETSAAAGNADSQAQSARAQAEGNIRANANQPAVNADARLQGNTDAQRLPSRYESGYRGLNEQGSVTSRGNSSQDAYVHSGQAQFSGRAYRLRYDRYGREFICVNGRPVYFDSQTGSQPQAREAFKPYSDQMQGQHLDGQYYQRGMRHEDRQFHHDQYQDRSLQGNAYIEGENYGASTAPPAPPVPARAELDSAAATPGVNADSSVRAQQTTSANQPGSDQSAAGGAEADTSIDVDSSTDAGQETDATADIESSAADQENSTSESNDDAGNDNDSDSQSSSVSDEDAND